MSLKPCKDCGREVSTSAASCPNCGAPIRMSGVGCLDSLVKIVSVVLLIAIGFIYFAAKTVNGVSTESAGQMAAAEPNESAAEDLFTTWQKQTYTDDLSGKTVHSRWLYSSNELHLSFPYDEVQRAKLTVRQHPRYGLDVILSIEEGQFICRLDTCELTVSFDEKEPVIFKATGPADNSSNVLFIDSEARFLKSLKGAKKTVIEPIIYQHGSPSLVFNTESFTPP